MIKKAVKKLLLVKRMLLSPLNERVRVKGGSSGRFARLYYAFGSVAFSREQRAVLAG